VNCGAAAAEESIGVRWSNRTYKSKSDVKSISAKGDFRFN